MHRLRQSNKLLIAFAVASGMLLACRFAVAGATDKQLQLEVSINGQPTKLIAAFVETAPSKISSARSELKELGIAVRGHGPDDELIDLTAARLTYVYDEAKQTIDFKIGDAERIRKSYDARNAPDVSETTKSTYGLVTNYSAFASSGDLGTASLWRNFQGANVTLDSRFTSPHGTFSQSGIVGNIATRDGTTLRLDSTYTYHDEQTLTAYRAGDTISGGLNWTRPIRMAGAQVQSNYAMRSDLVTSAVPAFSGSAAVPSTVDVVINGVQAYTRQVDPGPFEINNLPVLSGGGEAKVIVRDASGKTSEKTVPFFASSRILKEGLSDFSVETGFARRRYGIESEDYDRTLVGSATLRKGITDWLTVEGHAEGTSKLALGGAGVSVRIADKAVASVALAGSIYEATSGAQAYTDVSTRVGDVTLSASALKKLGDYQDLASVTARPGVTGFASTGFITGSLTASTKPPKSRYALNASMPIEKGVSTLSAMVVSTEYDNHERSLIAGLTYSMRLFDQATVFATGFSDLARSNNFGVFAGITMPLGAGISGFAGVQQSPAGTTSTVEASKSIGPEAGSWGWRIRDAEGELASRSAAVTYRGEVGRIEGAVRQLRGTVGASVTVDGAVTLADGGVFVSNRIDDSFAVVDAGYPGLRVLRENQLVGHTGADGKMLIPNMHSYVGNRIAIDPLDLPLDVEVTSATQQVMPGYRSGIGVKFDVKRQPGSALLALKRADGSVVPVGAEARLETGTEMFVVGYDGQVYVTGVTGAAVLVVKHGDAECRVQVTPQPQGAEQQIRTEVCR